MPLFKFVLLTVSVAVAPLTVVPIKDPPEVGLKLKPMILVGEPLTVTMTFCEATCPPVCALNVTWLGFAVATLLPPAPTVKVTLRWVDWPPLAVTVISPV